MLLRVGVRALVWHRDVLMQLHVGRSRSRPRRNLLMRRRVALRVGRHLHRRRPPVLLHIVLLLLLLLLLALHVRAVLLDEATDRVGAAVRPHKRFAGRQDRHLAISARRASVVSESAGISERGKERRTVGRGPACRSGHAGRA